MTVATAARVQRDVRRGQRFVVLVATVDSLLLYTQLRHKPYIYLLIYLGYRYWFERIGNAYWHGNSGTSHTF